MSLYLVIAIESLCVMPLHVLWTYLTLRAYSSKYWPTAILVCVLHLLQGCAVGEGAEVDGRRCSTRCLRAASTQW